MSARKASRNGITSCIRLKHPKGPSYIAYRLCNREGGGGGHGRHTIYDGIDIVAFDSLYYLESRNHLAPWGHKSMDIIQDALRNVYSLSTSGGESPPAEQPYFYTPRFGITETAADDEIISCTGKSTFLVSVP